MQKKDKKKAFGSYSISIALLFAVIVFWQFFLPEALVNVLPRPSMIIRESIDKGSSLISASMYTIFEAFMGFMIGNIVAILIAVWILYSSTAFDTIYPGAIILRSIPLVGLTPFVVMAFGQGVTSKIVIVALTVFFPTLINMYKGFRTTDRLALEYLHTLSANEGQIFFKLRLPSSLPYLFSSLKISASSAVLGAIVGEWMGAMHGLGAIIVQAMFNMQGNLLWAAMMWATMISVIAYVIMCIIEPLCIPWHETIKNKKLED